MIKFKTRNDFIEIFRDKDSIIAEIGVFRGDFAAKLLDLNPSELHLVDPFSGIVGSGDKDGQNFVECNLEEALSELQDRYKDEPRVRIIKSIGESYLLKCDKDYFDFIYIDADHSYFSTLQLLIYGYSRLKAGGILAGHDFDNKSVERAVTEFITKRGLSIDYFTEIDVCPSFGILKPKTC